MPQFSQAWPTSFCSPLWAITKFVSSSLIGVWLLTGRPSFCAAHCSQRCFSIFLPCLLSVRWTVAVLLQLSHFIESPHRRKLAVVQIGFPRSRPVNSRSARRGFRAAAVNRYG